MKPFEYVCNETSPRIHTSVNICHNSMLSEEPNVVTLKYCPLDEEWKYVIIIIIIIITSYSFSDLLPTANRNGQALQSRWKME